MPATASTKPSFSRFAVTLLVGGLIGLGGGLATLYRAQAEAEGMLVPGIVTRVSAPQGRFAAVTYRYEAPGLDGKPRSIEKTVLAPADLAGTWAPERRVQVRVAKDDPERSDLAENRAPAGTGLQWLVFGAIATFFGALRLRRKPDEA